MTMTIVSISRDTEVATFARRAAEAFQKTPSIYTWAEGDPTPGQLLANELPPLNRPPFY
jgi:hypothetical protein